MVINCGSGQFQDSLTHNTRCIHPSKTPFDLGGWRKCVAVRNCIMVINKVDLPTSRNLVHTAHLLRHRLCKLTVTILSGRPLGRPDPWT